MSSAISKITIWRTCACGLENSQFSAFTFNCLSAPPQRAALAIIRATKKHMFAITAQSMNHALTHFKLQVFIVSWSLWSFRHVHSQLSEHGICVSLCVNYSCYWLENNFNECMKKSRKNLTMFYGISCLELTLPTLFPSGLHHDRHVQPPLRSVLSVCHPVPLPLCLPDLWPQLGRRQTTGPVQGWVWDPGEWLVQDRVHHRPLEPDHPEKAEAA